MRRPISGDQWTLGPVASVPLVVCMRAHDPLAQQIEVQPLELAKRLKIFRILMHTRSVRSPDENAGRDWNPAGRGLPGGDTGGHSVDGTEQQRAGFDRPENSS